VPDLTPREREALQLAAEGLQYKQIARRLGLSAWTVKNHLANARAKLDMETTLGAVAQGLREGWLQ